MPGDNNDDTATIHTLGDDLLGVPVTDAATGQQVAAQLRQSGGWLDVVAGIDSVAVHFDLAEIDIDSARQQLNEQLRDPTAADPGPAMLVEIPVCYGGEFGPDFDAVCASRNLSPGQLIDLHTSPEYVVDMLGFTPGFAYIGGLADELNVPRLEQPRQHVAAGSIGIADGRSGVYAMPGPGGWPLIGRTPLRLFDAGMDSPFVLSAGTRIRFTHIDAEQFSELAKS